MPGCVVQEHAQSSPDPDSDGRTTSENLTADFRRPGTLSICVARSVHICPVCACAAHIYQFVLILGHRRRRARGVGAEGSRELPGHQLRGYYQLLPTEPIVIPSQTHHFVIPSASSDARANHQLYISPWWNPEKISQNENSCRFHFSDSPVNCLLLVLD